MRIKLRLYPRDLDLLTLKQTHTFNFSSVIKQSLYEYVVDGECERIYVPHIPNQEIVLKNDQVDITFSEDMYHEVIEWLLSIRPGMRNSAVKAVIRSAIANPVLSAYMINSNLVVKDKDAKAYIEDKNKGKNTAKVEHEPAPAKQNNATQTFFEENKQAEDEDDFDIFDFAENY